MDVAIPEALVTGYEQLIEGLDLPDPRDRHVLAAAIIGRADVIVTFNLVDFPPEYLLAFDLEALHPDEFLNHQLTLNESLWSASRRFAAGFPSRNMSPTPTSIIYASVNYTASRQNSRN